jgi:hypothetical protein
VVANAFVSIKGLVGDQQTGGHLREQRVGPDQIMRLPRCQQECQRIAERIDQGMDFCAQPAAAVADRLINLFFWGRRHCAVAPEQWCCRS